jgi:hypothetical protein
MKPLAANRQRWLAIIAGAGALLLITDRLVFTPLGNIWQAHDAEIAQLHRSIANGKAVIKRAEQTKRTWIEMQGGTLAKEVAQAEQDLISSFDLWGKASNIELGSINPQWKRGATDRYSLLECRLDATGSLPALSRFMYELELSPLALRVDSLELTTRDENGKKIALSIVVSGLRLAPLDGIHL